MTDPRPKGGKLKTRVITDFRYHPLSILVAQLGPPPILFPVPKFGSTETDSTTRPVIVNRCMILGCDVIVSKPQMPCLKHKCPAGECKRPSWLLSSLKVAAGKRHCSDHSCPKRGCDLPKAQWNLYCDYHRCSFRVLDKDICQKLSLFGMKYCASHACKGGKEGKGGKGGNGDQEGKGGQSERCEGSILCRDHIQKK